MNTGKALEEEIDALYGSEDDEAEDSDETEAECCG
jgi:hypothetical protein